MEMPLRVYQSIVDPFWRLHFLGSVVRRRVAFEAQQRRSSTRKAPPSRQRWHQVHSQTQSAHTSGNITPTIIQAATRKPRK